MPQCEYTVFPVETETDPFVAVITGGRMVMPRSRGSGERFEASRKKKGLVF